MNMFRFELKAQVKSFLIWAVSLLALLLVFVGAFFSVFMDSRDAMLNAISNLPPAFSSMFGVYIDTIFSFGGFYKFIYTYIGLVGAIMAASIGLYAFSREKRSKCVDFLYAKPVGRGRIFAFKLLSCFALIAAMNILYMVAAIFSYTGNGQDSAGLGTLVLAALSLFFLQLLFMSFGALYAVLAKKVRSVSGVATAFGFAGFIITALHSLIKEDLLLYVSPMTYFDPGTVFTAGGYDAKYVVTAAVVFAACLAAAYIKYVKSDTQAI